MFNPSFAGHKKKKLHISLAFVIVLLVGSFIISSDYGNSDDHVTGAVVGGEALSLDLGLMGAIVVFIMCSTFVISFIMWRIKRNKR